MFVLGLTGSIGMGKSTAASLFRDFNIPVHDADATVHALMAEGGDAVDAIEKSFPQTVENGVVNRAKLGAQVFQNQAALHRLEAIIHPLVAKERNRFLKTQMIRHARFVVLDVPLLFETGGDAGCDAVAVVTAPPFVQAARVLARPGVDLDRLTAIRAKQTPDSVKRRLADFIIHSGAGKRRSRQDILKIYRWVLAQTRTGAWPPKPGTVFGREKGWHLPAKRPTVLKALRCL